MVIVFSEAALKLATKLPLPLSPELLSLIEIVGAGSSSTIVIVAEPAVVLIVALSGEDNVKVNVSSSSSVESDYIAMLTVLVKSPGLNVRVVADIAV